MTKPFDLLVSKNNFPQLIPSHKKVERRLLSVLMTSLEILPEFRGMFLKEFEYGSGKTCTYSSHMEPHYDHPTLTQVRPDGLIICKRGASTWTAFIEAKAGSQVISAEQMQGYTDLASKLGVDAVISISNTYSAAPDELPYHLPIGKRKKRSVFHIAWPQVRGLLDAVASESELTDSEYSLAKHVIRFFSDPDQGIQTFDQMSPNWKQIVEAVEIGVNIKSIAGFTETVNDWQQERRDLVNKISGWIDGKVRLKHPAGVRASPIEKLKSDKNQLGDQSVLCAGFQLIDFKRTLEVEADLKSKTIIVEADIKIPSGKKARACMSWLAKVLTPLKERNYYLKITWPNYGSTEPIELSDFLNYPDALAQGRSEAPKFISLIQSNNDVRTFKSRKGFIQSVEKLIKSTLLDLEAEGLIG